MALKSGGNLPPTSGYLDGNQVLAVLDGLHFWSSKRINSDGRRVYRIDITHAGRRGFGHGSTFNLAAMSALANLKGDRKPGQRLHQAPKVSKFKLRLAEERPHD